MTPPKRDRILYGAAYYNEYHQSERTTEDFELMLAAGLNVIRVGESVWQKWQPTENSFDLDWLEPVLNTASQAGISVIIGTPTYAVPRWVFLKHPEVIAERAGGAKVPFGHRQNVDYSNPKFRQLCEVVIRKIVERYSNHPAVIGWQVDNEPGAEILHNEGVFQAFKAKLAHQYGSIDALNSAWGLTYWSHALGSFDELWRPEGNTNPSYLLAWRQHQAEVTNDFLSWQRDLVRSLIPQHQFITTCVALDRPGMDNQTIGTTVDVASVNVYYASQDGLGHPRTAKPADELTEAPLWVPLTGASALNLTCDTAWSIKQENFLVTETNGSAIQQGSMTSAFPHWPGQFKQAALAMVSRGAEMIEYWHWHTLPFGIENHWGGILPHSLQPGRSYRAFQETARTLEAVSGLGRLTPAAEVAIVINTASKWLFEYQGPIRGANGLADPLAYQKTLQSMYEIAFETGLGVRLIGDNQIAESPVEFARKHPIMILHSLYSVSEATLTFSRQYAEAGGKLLVGPRTGYAKEDTLIRTSTAPAILGEPAGVSYSEYSMLAKPQSVVDDSGAKIGSVWAWFDELEASADDTVLRADHPFFGEFAAMTNRKVGAGSISFLAGYPDQRLSAWLGARFKAEIPKISSPGSTNASVIVNRCLTEAGAQVNFVFNWGWDEASVILQANCTDVETGENFAAGQTILLGSWGVRILVDSQ